MKLYSNTFKRAVIKYYNKICSVTKVISVFGICRKTLYNWKRLGNNLYKTIKYKKSKSTKYTSQIMNYIKKYIINKDNFKMKNLLRTIKRKFNCSFNKYNIYYVLKKLDITYKKAHKIVRINKKKHKKDTKYLINKINKINKIGCNKIISTDECHFQTNMKPNMGWNKKGKKVTFIKNTGKRTNVSLICSITNKEIVHFEIHKSAVKKNIFIDYIKKINKKKNRTSILLDNARVHHSIDLKKYMKNKSNKLLYNVPYNLETNPIEQLFNKLKSFVRKQNTSTYKKLSISIKKGLNTITTNNLNYYFSNSFKKH